MATTHQLVELVMTKMTEEYPHLVCLTDIFTSSYDNNKVVVDIVILDSEEQKLAGLTVDLIRQHIEIESIRRSRLYSGHTVMSVADSLAVYLQDLTGFDISLYNVAVVSAIVAQPSSPTPLSLELNLQLLQFFTQPLDFYNKFGYFPVAAGSDDKSALSDCLSNYLSAKLAVLNGRVEDVIIGRLRQLLDNMDTDIVMLNLFEAYIDKRVENSVTNTDGNNGDNNSDYITPTSIRDTKDVFDIYLRRKLGYNYPMMRLKFIEAESQQIMEIINYLQPWSQHTVIDSFNHLLADDVVNFNRYLLIGLARYITPVAINEDYSNITDINDSRVSNRTQSAVYYFPFSFSHLLLKTYNKILSQHQVQELLASL